MLSRVVCRITGWTLRKERRPPGIAFSAETGLERIQQSDAAPVEVVDWYREELGITVPKLQGALLNLSLLKSRLEFYKQLGVSSIEFGELISQTPEVMAIEHSGTARENLVYLLSNGLSSFLLCHVLMKMPLVLTLSLEAHLKPRMAYYREELLFSGNEMLKIFEECPEFLQYSIVKDIRFRIRYLRSIGLAVEDVTKTVILQCPHVLGSTFHEEIQPLFEYVRSVTNTHCLQTILLNFPHAMLLSMEDQVKPFMNYFLDELKMGRRLVGQMIDTHPKILTVDIDRDVRPKIEFLQKLGLDQLQLFKIVVLRPQILKKSLKTGIVQKIEELTSMGVPPEIVTTLLLRSPKFFS